MGEDIKKVGRDGIWYVSGLGLGDVLLANAWAIRGN